MLTESIAQSLGFPNIKTLELWNDAMTKSMRNRNIKNVSLDIKSFEHSKIKGGYRSIFDKFMNRGDFRENPSSLLLFPSDGSSIRNIMDIKLSNEILGMGGFGVVFKGVIFDPRPRFCAIKFGVFNDYMQFIWAVHEIDTLTTLSSHGGDSFPKPYLCSLSNIRIIVENRNGSEYLGNLSIYLNVMELLDGDIEAITPSNDWRYLKLLGYDHFEKEIDLLLSIGSQTVKGLVTLRERNISIVHRDLKSENVFYKIIRSNSGKKSIKIKIGDFGLAIQDHEIKHMTVPEFTNEFIKNINRQAFHGSTEESYNVETFRDFIRQFRNEEEYRKKGENTLLLVPGTITIASPELLALCGIDSVFEENMTWAFGLFKKFADTLPEDMKKLVNQKKYTATSDVFSLGCMLFFIWFGVKPFVPKDGYSEEGSLRAKALFVKRMLRFSENQARKYQLSSPNYKLVDHFIKEKITLKGLLKSSSHPTRFLKAFLEALLMDERTTSVIINHPLLSIVAYEIALMMLPNPYSNLELKIKEKLKTVAQRPTIYEISRSFFIAQHFTDVIDETLIANNSNRIIDIYDLKPEAFNIKRLMHSIRILSLKSPLFDENDFGVHNSKLCMTKIPGSDKIMIEEVSNTLVPTRICTHTLERISFAEHLLENHTRIKNRQMHLCYECEKETGLMSKINLKFSSVGADKWHLNFEPDVFLGTGASGRVFTLRHFDGYVIKILPLEQNTKEYFLRGVNMAIAMGEAGIGPGVEAFWINDEPQNLPPYDDFAPKGCGCTISRKMDTTLYQFKKNYRISQGDKNYNKLMEFSKKFKEVSWRKGVRIPDLSDENIMLNVNEDGTISDVRIGDFGTHLSLDIDKTPLLSIETDDPISQGVIEDLNLFKKVTGYEIENMENNFESSV